MDIIAELNRGAQRRQRFVPTCTEFAGGEAHVVLPAELLAVAEQLRSVRIRAWLRNALQVMQLIMLTDAVRRAAPNVPVHLDMPYVPYARQDRVCNPGEALSAKVFCDLINAQGFASVTVIDPHSTVVTALIERVSVIDASVFVRQVLDADVFAHGVTLLAPDAGARDRVESLAARLGGLDTAFAEKRRDPRDGRIVEMRFPAKLSAQPILVVDDICDGGRTFIELARAAREVTDQPLYLYVTHGIFSRGLDALRGDYAGVFTAYDWTGSSDPMLTVINQEGA